MEKARLAKIASRCSLVAHIRHIVFLTTFRDPLTWLCDGESLSKPFQWHSMHFPQATGAASTEPGFPAAAGESPHQRRSAILRAGAKAAAGGRASGRPDGVFLWSLGCDPSSSISSSASSSSFLPLPLCLPQPFVLVVLVVVDDDDVVAAPATAVFAENLCVAPYVGLGC